MSPNERFPFDPPISKNLAAIAGQTIKDARKRFSSMAGAKVALSLWQSGTSSGQGHAGAKEALYPASVVKLFYLIAAEAEIEAGRLKRTKEHQRAADRMIRLSSNNATNYIVDLLSGVTSGPELPPAKLKTWAAKRRAVNRYFQGLKWPELADFNATQKTWDDGPFGREWQSRYELPNNHNRISAQAAARAIWEVAAGRAVSPAASRRIRGLLARQLDPKAWGEESENQVEGFLGQGLPQGAKLWSKAGWTSQVRHDVGLIELADGTTFVAAAFIQGKKAAADTRILPFIAKALSQRLAQKG